MPNLPYSIWRKRNNQNQKPMEMGMKKLHVCHILMLILASYGYSVIAQEDVAFNVESYELWKQEHLGASSKFESLMMKQMKEMLDANEDPSSLIEIWLPRVMQNVERVQKMASGGGSGRHALDQYNYLREISGLPLPNLLVQLILGAFTKCGRQCLKNKHMNRGPWT